MNKSYDDFLNQLDQNYLSELSNQITKDFSTHNNYPDGAIPFKDFATFSNYSSYTMTVTLLGKYHDWLNS